MSPLHLENIAFVWSYLLYDDMMVIIQGVFFKYKYKKVNLG